MSESTFIAICFGIADLMLIMAIIYIISSLYENYFLSTIFKSLKNRLWEDIMRSMK